MQPFRTDFTHPRSHPFRNERCGRIGTVPAYENLVKSAVECGAGPRITWLLAESPPPAFDLAAARCAYTDLHTCKLGAWLSARAAKRPPPLASLTVFPYFCLIITLSACEPEIIARSHASIRVSWPMKDVGWQFINFKITLLTDWLVLFNWFRNITSRLYYFCLFILFSFNITFYWYQIF